MHAPFTFQVRYEIRCGYCEREAVVSFWKMHRGSVLPVPSVPSDWRVLDGVPVCPDHLVAVGDRPWRN